MYSRLVVRLLLLRMFVQMVVLEEMGDGIGLTIARVRKEECARDGVMHTLPSLGGVTK